VRDLSAFISCSAIAALGYCWLLHPHFAFLHHAPGGGMRAHRAASLLVPGDARIDVPVSSSAVARTLLLCCFWRHMTSGIGENRGRYTYGASLTASPPHARRPCATRGVRCAGREGAASMVRGGGERGEGVANGADGAGMRRTWRRAFVPCGKAFCVPFCRPLRLLTSSLLR